MCIEHGTGCNKGIKNDETLVSVLKMFGWQNDVWKAFYNMPVSVLTRNKCKILGCGLGEWFSLANDENDTISSNSWIFF